MSIAIKILNSADNPTPYRHYKCYTLLAALYIALFLSTIILSRKLVQIGPAVVAVATFIIPLGYGITDIITEVYGYIIARHLLWVYIICGFIFSSIMEIATFTPSPAYWPLQSSYVAVLGHSLQISTASMLGLSMGILINSYALSKWKILLKGKYFWMRSLGASAVGEFIFIIIALPLSQFNNIIIFHDLITMMFISYISKLLFTCIAVVPIAIITKYIKKVEGFEVYDFQVKFSPFTFGISDANKDC